MNIQLYARYIWLIARALVYGRLQRHGFSLCKCKRRVKCLSVSVCLACSMRRKLRPRLLEPYKGYLAGKIGACPGLSGRRLFREIRELGYEGGMRR